jgi:hypothetical protein
MVPHDDCRGLVGATGIAVGTSALTRDALGEARGDRDACWGEGMDVGGPAPVVTQWSGNGGSGVLETHGKGVRGPGTASVGPEASSTDDESG